MFSCTRYGKSFIPNTMIEQALLTQSYPVVILDFPGAEIDSSASETILFDSVEAAQEVAYVLRGTWDGCNGVELSEIDWQALKTSASLVDGQWCAVGDSQLVAIDKRADDPQMHSYELLSLDFRDSTFIDIRTEHRNLLALPDCREISFPISRAEVYWAIADSNDSSRAEDVANETGYRKSTVQGHLSALEKAGAIRSEGRPKQYTVAEDCPQEYLSQLQPLSEIARTTRCYWR